MGFRSGQEASAAGVNQQGMREDGGLESQGKGDGFHSKFDGKPCERLWQRNLYNYKSPE